MGERGRGSSPAVANETPPPYVSLKSRRFSAKSRFVKILFFCTAATRRSGLPREGCPAVSGDECRFNISIAQIRQPAAGLGV